MIKIGTAKQAKHAIRCIDALCKDKEQIFSQLFEVFLVFLVQQIIIIYNILIYIYFEEVYRNYEFTFMSEVCPSILSILQQLEKSLYAESSNFLTSIVAIGHLAQLCPSQIAAPTEVLVSKYIFQELLMKDKAGSLCSHFKPRISRHIVASVITNNYNNTCIG